MMKDKTWGNAFILQHGRFRLDFFIEKVALERAAWECGGVPILRDTEKMCERSA